MSSRNHFFVLLSIALLYFALLWRNSVALDAGVAYVVLGYFVAILGSVQAVGGVEKKVAAISAGYAIVVIGVANGTVPLGPSRTAAGINIACCGLAAVQYLRALRRDYAGGKRAFRGRVRPEQYYALFLWALAIPTGFAFSSDFISYGPGVPGISPGKTALTFLALAAVGFARLAPNPILGLRAERQLTALALLGLGGGLAFQAVGPRDWYSLLASAAALLCSVGGLWGGITLKAGSEAGPGPATARAR